MNWKNEPHTDARDMLSFWFEELNESHWYAKDPVLDAKIRARFAKLHTQAAQGELFRWRGTPAGRLAEIILLDQFSRNIFRDQARAFQYDAMALVLAQEAVARGADKAVEPRLRSFFYLPYMHSESIIVHGEAEKLYAAFDKGGWEWEIKHKKVIDRFGRYPHRNEILGRPSTPEEEAFLKEPGSSF